MSDECVREIGSACSPKTLQEATESGKSQVFEVCLPFGAKLYSQGGYVNYEAGTAPEDGVYTSVTVRNGCIVAVGFADISTYTATPCTPVPNPCDCSGSGGGSTPISPTAGNLSRLDASGALLTLLSVEAGDGIALQGKGTTTDPLIITANPDEAALTQVQSGNAAIIVEGAGTAENPYKISHAAQQGAVTAQGFTFDQYGHLIDYNAPSTAGSIKGIIAGKGVSVDTNVTSGISTIELATPLHAVAGEYQFGAWAVDFDEKNMVYTIERVFTFPAGTYRLGRYDVRINEYGSITGITQLGNLVVANSVSHYYGSAVSNPSLTFTTDKVASFRVAVEGPSVPSLTIRVDGSALTGHAAGASKFIAQSGTLWAAGSHTVSITGDLAAYTFVNIQLTTVV